MRQDLYYPSQAGVNFLGQWNSYLIHSKNENVLVSILKVGTST